MQSSSSKKVGIWIRVSTEMQVQTDSPEHHEQRARDFARFKGWEVVEVYRLDGVSGSVSLQHPEASRMLRDIDTGRITALIFSKFARVARDGIGLRLLLKQFKAAKADLVSLDEQIDTSTASGELLFGLIADLAEWERKEIANRVRSSILPRAKSGKNLGGAPPYGYHWVENKLVPHPELSKNRILVHELYLKHQRFKAVANELNRRGIPGRLGGKWSDTTVRWLIADTTSKGIHKRNSLSWWPDGRRTPKPEEDIVYVPVEPIISEELWNRCFAIAEGRRFKTRGRWPKRLFAGYINCECGNPMLARSNNELFRCKQVGCKNKVKINLLEELFVKSFGRDINNLEWAVKYTNSIQEVLRQKEAEIAKLQGDQTAAKTVIQKAFELVLSGGMPKERYGIICEPHEKRLSEIEREVGLLKYEITGWQQTLTTAETVHAETNRLVTSWPTMEFSGKREFVEAHLENIEVSRARHVIFTLHYIPGSEKAAKWQRTLIESASLSQALQMAVNFGGDTDTVAAMALGAGSCFDEIEKNLPTVLFANLENGLFGRDYLQSLDQALV